MTMHDEEEYSDASTTNGGYGARREVCYAKQLKNGHNHHNNGIRRHKVSRLTDSTEHISYPPSIEQLEATSLWDSIPNGRTDTYFDSTCDQLDSNLLGPVDLPNGHNDTNVDKICEQLRLSSIDLSNVHELNGCLETRAESRRHEHTFEADVVFRKDRDGDTLLHTALILLEATLAFIFIDMAPLPEYLSIKNLMCQSPLHLATLVKLPEVVRRLVVAGAEVDVRDKDGHTPLHIACRDGSVSIVRHLLEPVRYLEMKKNRYEIPYQKIPQDLTIRNYEGLTIFHLAAINNHLDIIELLIEAGIDINMKEGKAGWSVLHYACERGNINLVRLLLRYRRCNINARTYDGSTPFDLARDRGHEIVCMTLAAAGARHGEEEYPDSD